jgi:hypothetical protein
VLELVILRLLDLVGGNLLSHMVRANGVAITVNRLLY